MISDLVYSPCGVPFARTPDWAYGSENNDTDPFALVQMLRNAFPERQYEFCVCCFGGYENAVSL